MDIDRFIARNEQTWARLELLTRIARHDVGDLDESQFEELIQLYQRVSAQLSHARTYVRDPSLTARLTRLVASASSVIYGKRGRSLATFTEFFRITFPAAVWYNRRFVALASAVFFAPALVMLLWLTHSPEALEASGPAAEREEYAEDQFAQYYSEQPSAQFATLVGINNVQVSFLAFFGGAAAMVPGLYVLATNGIFFGQAAAWMTTEGEATTFWTLIAPHGLLELTSIVLAGAAGLRVGWTLIAPGDDRTRAEAMAEEGRRAGGLVLGLMAFFGIAALVEGFVTGSALPVEVKVTIGVVIWLAFVLYVVTFGREAAAAGFTGRFGELERPPAPKAGGREGQATFFSSRWAPSDSSRVARSWVR